jgi:hypothetical protein
MGRWAAKGGLEEFFGLILSISLCDGCKQRFSPDSEAGIALT